MRARSARSLRALVEVVRTRPRAVLAAAGLLLLGGLLWLLGPGAGWVLEHVDGVTGVRGRERAELLDAVRGRALTMATGLVALVAVYYTARNADTARRTYEVGQSTLALAELGHVADRYTKAIEQLGSGEPAVRLGGIYALERIARDSARDHSTVMEVLTAFVREPPPLAGASAGPGAGAPAPVPPPSRPGRPRLRADVQAAISVIGRRNVTYDHPGRRIDLAEAHLAGADLAGADLHGADLAQADLTDAELTGADLSHANLWRANLTRADLVGAHLEEAILENADLTEASLDGANLDGANLQGALGFPMR